MQHLIDETTRMESGDQLSEREAIEATEKRIYDSFDWESIRRSRSPSEKEMKGLSQALRAESWQREVGRFAQKIYNRCLEEFTNGLWDTERERVDLTAYLALKELDRTLQSESHQAREIEAAHDKEVEALKGLIKEVLRSGHAVHRGELYLLDTVPPGFVFERRDLPYLRQWAANFGKMAAGTKVRKEALSRVLNAYEEFGRPPGPAVRRLQSGDLPAEDGALGMTDRDLVYCRAVLDLLGQPFKHATGYAKAISDRCPKEDGDTPAYTAVFNWLHRKGLRKPGEAIEDFRAHLEQAAEAALGGDAVRGEGHEGNV